MHLFDAHAHYDDERFKSEYEGGADAALCGARRAGVEYIVNSGADLATSEASIALADSSAGRNDTPQIYASVGIHPTETYKYENMNDALDAVRALAARGRVVAIGEIGLDYHYPDTDKDVQREYFASQLELARELGMPVVIHDRDAHGDVYDIIKNFRGVDIMMHCYSGSAEMARQYAAWGMRFSFGGVLTYKNAQKTRESALAVPRESVLLETDAPYLAPVPHRGKINCSAYMTYTAAALASLCGVDADEAADVALCNAKAFYRI